MEIIGRRSIRSFMPDQHREFFAELPFLLVGSADGTGQPWASVLAGPPGFVTSPDPRHLEIRAQPLPGDPLAENLRVGAAVGLLGIQPHTRRRNRMNGTVEAVNPAGFRVAVVHSFGNCPKYIQAREASYGGAAEPSPGTVHRAAALDLAMGRLVRAADTFYIATAFTEDDEDPAAPRSLDVSHRGGKPGFVRVDDERTLTVPEFIGNFLFNTLGNLVVEPRAGLLFMDFAAGDLLYLACEAEIVADSPELRRFQGAERLLRFSIRQALRVERALPLRWGAAELSPMLAGTGSW